MTWRSVAWVVGGLAAAVLALWLVGDRGASTVAARSRPAVPVAPVATASRPALPAPALPASAPGLPDRDLPGSAHPTSADDDPAARTRELVTMPDELFAAEPRDEAFAAARERELRTKLARLQTVAPGLPLTRLECRTRTCALTLAAPSRPPEAEIEAAFDVLHEATRVSDGALYINGPETPPVVHVYLQFSPEGPALAAGDAAQVRSAAPADWARFAREHPTESSALTGAITALWGYQSRAAFAVCGAPPRSHESPRYAIEGEAELTHTRATLSGWACLRAPAGEQAICDCVASWLSGETAVQVNGDPAVTYRGGISVAL